MSVGTRITKSFFNCGKFKQTETGVIDTMLHERLQECNGDEVLKAEAGAKVQKFTEWALKCIGFHSRCQGNRDRDFTEAFDAACFPLTLSLAHLILVGHLGYQQQQSKDCWIAQRNSLDVDVDLALGFASHYCKIGCTMVCEKGLPRHGPLPCSYSCYFQQSSRDCCLSPPSCPQHVLAALSIEILKAAGERSGDSIARSDDEAVAPELRAFLRQNWSEAAFLDGLREGQEHYMNILRILKWGESPICLRDLPGPLLVAIAYLPLYRECVEASGCLLSQRLRGQLVEAVRRLGSGPLEEVKQGRELLAILKHHLPPFLLSVSSIDTAVASFCKFLDLEALAKLSLNHPLLVCGSMTSGLNLVGVVRSSLSTPMSE
ncbi:Ankyrin repeat protein SKIP35 [Vitis vinifera]|uniref:Ankyrin repeat protein SKIP35 n=1 Tax=Vitis vinifera TaxID=29760 RepID=A0A438CBJ9_VITVI|nr:Ankyrin repeat protein SKIP35 [Vitis vinifera]